MERKYYPISIIIDGYVLADSFEEAQKFEVLQLKSKSVKDSIVTNVTVTDDPIIENKKTFFETVKNFVHKIYSKFFLKISEIKWF